MRYTLAVIVIGGAILLNATPATANDAGQIARLYDEYNELMKRADLDASRAYLSKEMAKGAEACRTDRRCRMADDISRAVDTLLRYEIVDTLQGKNGHFGLRVRGQNSARETVDLILYWKREGGHWKIDKIMKVPRDWYPPFWKRRTTH